MDFSQRLSQRARLVDVHLRELLEDAVAKSTPGCGSEGRRLAAAMREAALQGGKRLRPLLVMETAALFDVNAAACLNAAAAIECVHCYSLVHDDLPCMDNDELRRGKPTIWKAFDEWTAVLAGDALLTLSFEILAREETHAEPNTRLAMITTLAEASGVRGMVQGQALDLAASKRGEPKPPTIASTKTLQDMKTGALIEAACAIGGLLGGADVAALASLRTYGSEIGFAYQISDDLLDLEGTKEKVGKATGKDTADGKATLVALLGKNAARAELDRALQRAHDALKGFDMKADSLHEIADFVAKREH